MNKESLKEKLAEKWSEYPAKFIQQSFDKINEILNLHEGESIIPKLGKDSYKVTLSKNSDKGFTASFEGLIRFDKLTKDDRMNPKIKLKKDDVQLELTNVQTRGIKRSTKLTRKKVEDPFTGSQTLETHVEGFSLGANKKSFYRQVLKIESFQISTVLETEPLYIVDQSSLKNLFYFSVDKSPYSLFTTSMDGDAYLIIDSEKVTDFDTFSTHSYAACVALGFITCNFFQTECWCLESNNKNFTNITNVTYNELRDSISSNYKPIHQNSFAYYKEPLPENIPQTFNIIDTKIFSKLCDEICKNKKFLGVLIIFMEAHNLSVYSRGASYSVTLEMLTQLIADKNAGFKPIVNKPLSRELIKKLNLVLDDYKEKITDPTINKTADFIDSMRILEKKIKDINSPTNKDKLSIPFQLYEIDIIPGSDEDKAISHRNSFLHGNDLRTGDDEYLSEYETWGVTLNLVTMINKLILKYIGYSGYTINYAEYNLNHDNTDPNKLFVKI